VNRLTDLHTIPIFLAANSNIWQKFSGLCDALLIWEKYSVNVYAPFAKIFLTHFVVVRGSCYQNKDKEKSLFTILLQSLMTFDWFVMNRQIHF